MLSVKIIEVLFYVFMFSFFSIDKGRTENEELRIVSGFFFTYGFALLRADDSSLLHVAFVSQYHLLNVLICMLQSIDKPVKNKY